MIGCFDNHLMRADSVHTVEHSLALTIQLPFDLEHRELVRHNTQGPAGFVRASTLPECQNFRGCLLLGAITEGAEAVAKGTRRLAHKVGRALGKALGPQYPAA